MLFRDLQRGCELRPSFERIGSFAGFDFRKSLDKLEALCLCKPRSRSPSPDLPCRSVETRMYAIALCIGILP